MRKYIEKYPWLRTRSLYSTDIYYDAMDDMPEGWRIAFGDMLCEELDAAIKKAGLEDEFTINQLKEKYGALVIYVNHKTPEIHDILSKYEALSKHVCIECGRPDARRLRLSWIAPFCRECYSDSPYSAYASYDELAYTGDGKMGNSITVEMWDERDGCTKTRKISTKDTADKIRARWVEREIGRS